MKNADGSNAKYEDDFVANDNGTKLTEDQYDNLLNGYFTADNVKDRALHQCKIAKWIVIFTISEYNSCSSTCKSATV